MTPLPAQVADYLGVRELRRLGLQDSETGLSRETLAMSYADAAAHIDELYRPALPRSIADAVAHARTQLTGRLRNTIDVFGPQAQAALQEELDALARRVAAMAPDGAGMTRTLEEAVG
jgi:uncharacterized protein (DUF1501 family)